MTDPGPDGTLAERPRVSGATRAQRCAYCHGPAEADTRACGDCGTVLHEDCWAAAGDCPSLGCATPIQTDPKEPEAQQRTSPRRGLIAGIAILGIVLGGLLFLNTQDVRPTPAAVAHPFQKYGVKVMAPSDRRRRRSDSRFPDGPHPGRHRAGPSSSVRTFRLRPGSVAR